MSRLLVVDDSLNKRIATEFKRRGRNATSVAELGLKGEKDPPLLKRLHEIDPNCVLITGDDAMPATHVDDLKRFETTLAVIVPWDPSHGLSETEWEREIAHRWAHLMEAQPTGSILRYALNGRKTWTLRKRPSRLI